MPEKKLRTNADMFSFLTRRGVASIKVPEAAPDEIKELVNHVQESVEEKFENAEVEEAHEGTIETEGEEVDDS